MTAPAAHEPINEHVMVLVASVTVPPPFPNNDRDKVGLNWAVTPRLAVISTGQTAKLLLHPPVPLQPANTEVESTISASVTVEPDANEAEHAVDDEPHITPVAGLLLNTTLALFGPDVDTVSVNVVACTWTAYNNNSAHAIIMLLMA